MIEIYDDLLREELAKITPLERATGKLTDGIAARIDEVMKRKGITKIQLAKMTGHRPSEVSKWLGGGHNFTCKTIALISEALGEDLVRVVKSRTKNTPKPVAYSFDDSAPLPTAAEP